jgi:uncharacterized protein YkwD
MSVNPVIGLCSIIAAVLLPFAAPVSQQPAVDAVTGVRARLINQINEHRHSAGLSALTLDPVAQQAAQLQAQFMESSGTMQHKDSDGRSPMQRYLDLGGRASLYGENVAYYGDYFTEGDAVWHAVSKLDEMMMAERPPTDGHRENILSPAYRSIGIGVAIGPNGIYIAEDFVTPYP